MARPSELAEDQRRTLDILRPVAERLGLYLAGGTALTIHLGHRLSRDVALFSLEPGLDIEQVRSAIAAFPDFQADAVSDVALRFRIAGVPVDVVRYQYPLLNPTSEGPGHFPVASLEDLATMKLSAAARRGIRRDFWDLHEIFTRKILSLEQALDSYVRRFGVQRSDVYHVLKALTYFDEAEADALFPFGLTAPYWEDIKSWFAEHVPAAVRGRLQFDTPR